MAISKSPSGWTVDIQPGGRGAKRYRKTLPTKAEALTYEAWLTTKKTQTPDWQPAKRDGRRLLDLVDLWHKHHGVNLRAGSKYTSAVAELLCASNGQSKCRSIQSQNYLRNTGQSAWPRVFQPTTLTGNMLTCVPYSMNWSDLGCGSQPIHWQR